MADPRIRYDILATAEGGADIERLARALEQVDAAVDPAAAARAQALAAELRELGAQRAAIGRFVELKEQTQQAAAALEQAQAAAQAMGREMSAAETPTRAQTGQMAKLADAVRAAKADLQAQTVALDGARGRLTELGIATDQLAATEVRLRAAVEGAAASVRELGAQQQAVARFQDLAAATDKARVALAAAEGNLAAFRASLAGVTEPTALEARELDRLTLAARSAQIAVQQQAQAQAQAGAALRAAGVDTERLLATQARIPGTLAATAAAAERVAAGYRADAAAAAQSAAAQTAATRQITGGLDTIAAKLDGIRNLGVAGILGSQTFQMLKGVAETADAYANLGARIKLVTGEGEAFRAGFEGVYQVATRTSSALESTGTLFARIAQAGKEIGVGQAEALRLTETINQAVQLSGASAASSDAAITQLIQGLQSGVLRGEEFNSVMEQAPRLAQALAAGLGVTTGELRRMANEGQLSSATVIQALQSQAGVLRAEFGSLPPTIGRAITNLQTEWSRLVGSFDESSGATALVAEGINKIAANLDAIGRIATEAGAALTAALAFKGVAALRAMTVEGGLAAASMAALGRSISTIPTVVNVAIAVTGFEIGYQIGAWLRENSALARQLGIGITEFFTGLISDLQFVKEAAAAIFTDDTIGAAFDRYKARAEEQRGIFQQMYADAEQSPAAIRRAADEAAAATQGVGAAATAAGQQVQSSAAGAAASYTAIGAAATAAGAQAGAAATLAAGGTAQLSEGAKAAQAAFQGLAADAKIQLPAVGVTVQAQAAALADLAGRSTQAATALATGIPAALDKLSGASLAQFRDAFVAALDGSISKSRALAAQLDLAGGSVNALIENAPQAAQALAQSLGVSVAEMRRLVESGAVSSEKALAAADAQARLLQTVLAETGKQAAQSLGVDVAGLATGLSTEFQKAQDNLSVLIRSMPALQASGVDAGAAVAQALGKMIDGAKSQAELDAIRVRLEAMGASGQLNGAAVAGGLQAIADKADTVRVALEDATPGVQTLAEAARRAGVDIGLLTTGVSKGFGDSVQVVADLRQQIEASGVSAQIASPVLAQAFDQRIAAAATTQELALLRAEIERAAAGGQLLGTAGAAALAAIKAKAEELSPAMRQAQADAALLGVTLGGMGASAQAGTQASLEAYERLKAGGKASQAELAEAFVSVANAAIQAAGGIVPEWVKVEAQARGAVITTDEFGVACLRAAGAAQTAGPVIIQSWEATVAGIESATAAVERNVAALHRAREIAEAFDTATRNAKVSAESKAADDARRTLNRTAIDNTTSFRLKEKLAAGTLTPADLPAAQAYLEAARANLTTAQGSLGSFSFEGFSGVQADYNAARSIVEKLTSGRAGGAAGGSSTSSGVSAGVAAHLQAIADQLAARTAPTAATPLTVAVNVDGATIASAVVRNLQDAQRSAGA